jgi:SMC interacting uncharacterized protein involved in chromosome segregation
MEQATSLTDRFETARGRVEEEIERVQKQIQTRRKQLEKQLNASRKDFEKQTRKQVRELRKSPVVKDLTKFADEANRQIEGAFETVLAALQIASKHDVDRIDRKLTKINKRLKDIERARQGNGRASTPPVARV